MKKQILDETNSFVCIGLTGIERHPNPTPKKQNKIKDWIQKIFGVTL